MTFYCSVETLRAGSSPRLLDWDSIQRKLPWNVIILLGSGFAIADAAEVSEPIASYLHGGSMVVFKGGSSYIASFVVKVCALFSTCLLHVK